MRQRISSDAGLGLIETMIAMLVLTVGAISMASVFLYGMDSTTSSPNELVATQKAAEAIESVFSARDAHTIVWAELRNDEHGGIFIDGPTDMTTAGPDGILNTEDDGDIESVVLPGPDQTQGTNDDVTQTLTGFKREIRITDLNAVLRQVDVVITYPAGSVRRTFTLTAFISAFA